MVNDEYLMFDQGIKEIKADYNHKANKRFVIFYILIQIICYNESN